MVDINDEENEEKSLSENELTEKDGYSCYYEDKKIKDENSNNINIKIFSVEEIKNQKPINYTFKIINNGKENWPDDVFLKCLNNDCDIYFLSTKHKEIIIDGDEQWYEFPVDVKFKNINHIKKKLHILKGYLESDKIGRIGNERLFCYFGIKVQ